MAVEVTCFSCQKKLTFAATPGRRDECMHCRADVHVCKNCQHYDPKAYNECKEPSAEVVREKDRSNFCDFFSPATRDGKVDKTAELKAAAEALFKKN